MKNFPNRFTEYIFILLFTILIPTITFSQINISGVVVDAKDNTPLKWAVVKARLIADSSIVSATETTENGLFSISNLIPGEYNLYFTYTGYSAKVLKLNLKEGTTFIDTVKLASSEYRTDVVRIESEMPEMRFDGDKKIFSTDKMISTTGGTALDVLRRIPMLDVDMNDNVTLRGSTNAIILIDNKPMKFASLKQLPANAVKDVEIITTPSAKYEAEGVTGIINIVTQSKNLDFVGYHGYLNGGARSDFSSGNLDAGVNMKKGKFEYFFSGGFYNYGFTSDANSLTDYTTTLNSYQSKNNSDGNYKIWFLSLGTEYIINDKNTMGIDIGDNFVNYSTSSKGNNMGFNSNESQASLFQLDIQNRLKAHNYYASLYYAGKYDKKGRELNAEFVITGNPGDGNAGTIRQRYDSLLIPVPYPYDQKETSENNYKTVTLTADYTHPFGDKTKMEAGYKGSFITNENDYLVDSLNYSTGQYVKDYSLINHFKLNNNVNAIYSTLNHTVKDFGIKLGLRLEHTYTKGELITNDNQFTKNYLNLFPSLNITQKIGMGNQFQLSYSRRITRPNTWRYNPFVNRSDPRNISFGNPELNPEFANSYELTHNYYGNIFSFTTSAFYRNSYDVISTYRYLVDSITTANTYTNSGTGKFYGVDFIASSSYLKWWKINATLSIYKSKYESSFADNYQSEEGTSLKANVRSNMKVSDLFNLEIFYSYRGKRITASGFIEPSSSLDIGISKKLFENKLSITLKARDIFNTLNWNSVASGEGFYTRNENKDNTRAISLNISFTFGNTKDYYQKSKENKENVNESQDTGTK